MSAPRPVAAPARSRSPSARWRTGIAAFVLALCTVAEGATLFAQTPLPAPSQKQRLIVLSDIEADPDDTQSFVRLMLYANEIDLEALIATTSVHLKSGLHPDSIRRVIDAYGRVRPNLARHQAGYPAPAALQALVVEGQPGYGMGAVGAGKDSAGSDRIIRALESADPRPLWVTAWGGANTLAQALFRIRETRSAEEADRLIARLRVYTISDQDDSGAWIRRTFPQLFYIVSPGGYGAGIWTGIHVPIEGIDNSAIGNAWLRTNIQQGHGPLGAAYPDVSYGMEGDTPSWLGLIPNGLGDPEHPDWGGWGGRYELYVPQMAQMDVAGFTGGVPIDPETRPIWTNAVDSLTPRVAEPYGRAVKPATRSFKDHLVTLWRWRDEIQNDFAARMAWSTVAFEDANHPPSVQLDHPDRFTVRSGAVFVLSALGTTDPDGDNLSYLWFHYPEAGSLKTRLEPLIAENIYRLSFRAPPVTTPQTAHFILKVTDKGMPALTRYRRVIVTILP